MTILDTVFSATARLHIAGDPATWIAFEGVYGVVRASEGRLLPDAVVRDLPEVGPDHPHREEWRIRGDSLRRLVNHLAARSGAMTIVDLGCGNGWMSRHLADLPGARVLGVDIHRAELDQAVRLFGGQPELAFLAGDIFSLPIPAASLDIVVAASCIQYFPDLRALVRRLRELLAPGGELHLLDSPLYARGDQQAAAARSTEYFRERGHSEMNDYYFHHCCDDLSGIPHRFLHDPDRPVARLTRRLGWTDRSPFPWVVIPAAGEGGS